MAARDANKETKPFHFALETRAQNNTIIIMSIYSPIRIINIEMANTKRYAYHFYYNCNVTVLKT